LSILTAPPHPEENQNKRDALIVETIFGEKV
jgi:hypothetical protein